MLTTLAALRGTANSPFIPLHCFFPRLIYPFIFTFSHNISHFLNETSPDISLKKRQKSAGPRPGAKGYHIDRVWAPLAGERCRVAVRAWGGLNWVTEYFNYHCFPHSCSLKLYTQYEMLKGEKKHPVPTPECSCKAIIIKHPCICVQTIPQLLALILYTQGRAEKAQVDLRAPVSPPSPWPIHLGGICDTYEHRNCLQFQMSCRMLFTRVHSMLMRNIVKMFASLCSMVETEIIRCLLQHLVSAV